jgi:hypothetical protein
VVFLAQPRDDSTVISVAGEISPPSALSASAEKYSV